MKKINAVVLLLTLLTLSMPALVRAESVCKVGDKAQVLWKGNWYPATVLKTAGEQCFIHYDGYGNSWDEWVGSARYRPVGPPQAHVANFSEGTPVSVLWKGSWYKATVVKTSGNQWYIHYDGYGNNWDEWVGQDRIRSR